MPTIAPGGSRKSPITGDLIIQDAVRLGRSSSTAATCTARRHGPRTAAAT